MNILVHREGRQVGPYSIDEVRARVGTGELFPTDLAWVEGSPEWVPLSTILSGGVGAESPTLSGSYPPPGYVLWQPQSTELATTSLVLGILSISCFSLLTGIPAIICGHLARSRVQSAPDRFGGAGRALAGLIMGYVTLLPVLAAIIATVFGVFEKRSESAKSTAARVQITTFTMALDAFEVDTASYPTSYEGLDALIHQPANRPGWKGPYLKSIPRDPWSHAYIYHYPGKENPKHFDLVSTGPDGLFDTADDVRPGDEGRLNEELEESTQAKRK